MPTPKTIDLKSPWKAAVLGLLIPGAGHFYQGRYFKGTIYFVCLLSAFVYGQQLGAWQVVYSRNETTQEKLTYAGQAMVGVMAWPAMVQSRRAADPGNDVRYDVREPIETSFEGVLETFGNRDETRQTLVSGRIRLESIEGNLGPETRGLFEGETETGQAIELRLAGSFSIDRPIGASPGRFMSINVITDSEEPSPSAQRLEGEIPRPLMDWYQVPPNGRELQDLHRKLDKYYELALLFTLIGGLMNILAVWDAFEGPAYGMGDEPDPEPEGDPDAPKSPDAVVVA